MHFFSFTDTIASWFLFAFGAVLMVYRIFTTRLNLRWRKPILLGVQFSIGWITSVVFARLFTTLPVASICGLVGGLLSALISVWLSVHGIGSFLGALVAALIVGIPYNGGGEPFVPSWCAITIIIFSAFLTSLIFLTIPVVAKSWEIFGVPLMGSYGVLSPWVHNNLLLRPYGEEGHSYWTWLIWGLIAASGILIQYLCKDLRKIDIEDPLGPQNDIVRQLLDDEHVNQASMFQARFPEITKAMHQGGMDDPHHILKQGGLPNVTNQRGEPISQDQMKLIQICREDEEQRDRVLFGGGLY